MTETAPSGTGAAAPNKGALAVVFLTVVIDLMGFGLMMPLIPLYADDLGASDRVQGLLIAIYSLMQLVFAPLLGRLSDRIGRRPVLLLGLAGSCGSYALFGFATDLTTMFIARALAGAFGATVQTAQAYVADVTTPETRARGMGMIGAAFGIGFVIGPAVGGLLLQWSDRAPAFFASALSLAALGFGASRLVESRKGAAPAPSRSGSFRFAFADARRAILLPLFFVFVYCFANFESRFTRFGVDVHGYDKAGMSWMVTFVGLFVAAIQGGAIHKLVKRRGERPLFIAGTVLFGAGCIALGLSRGNGMLFLACALIGLGQGLASPTLNAMISKSTPLESQGAVFGVTQSISSLARLLGHGLAGYIYEIGAGLPFTASGAALFVVAAIFVAAPALRGAFGPAPAPPSREPAA